MDAPTPSASTRDEVHRRWRAGLAPDGDFIVFGDGSLLVMELQILCHSTSVNDEWAKEWRWNELLRATEWSVSNWVDADGCSARASHGGSHALVGESCSHGGIGYVALIRESDSSLEWLAISSASNPFIKVALDDTVLTAVSTAGRVWTFPRHTPQHVSITADPDYPWPGFVHVK
jgi:hypothetical protein